MQILTRNRVAMNRWGGEEKGNLITSLVAVGSLAGGNKASGTKGTLCSASGRQIAKNAGALMVIQVFGGSFDICQVPAVQCESRKNTWIGCLLTCGTERALSSGLVLFPEFGELFCRREQERRRAWCHVGAACCSVELGSGLVLSPP